MASEPDFAHNDMASRSRREKAVWSAAHPDRPEARREHPDEKIMWVKKPIEPWL